MAYQRPVKAAIFDMDGLLIDTEPFWQQAELEIFSAAGLDISLRDSFPETTGLRIDQVVSMWFEACQVTHLSGATGRGSNFCTGCRAYPTAKATDAGSS